MIVGIDLRDGESGRCSGANQMARRGIVTVIASGRLVRGGRDWQHETAA
jgi:hypothetical protein